MGNKTNQYSISLFRYPKKDGDAPIFRADLEMTCDFSDYRERVDGLIGKFESLDGETREMPHYVVCDKIQKDSDIYLEEDNLIFAMLYPCVGNDSIVIKKLQCGRTSYTDVWEPNRMPKNESRIISFTLTAHNGTERVKLYFLSPQWMIPESGETFYRLSNGFVIASPSRIYAGEYRYARLVGQNLYNVIDAPNFSEDREDPAFYTGLEPIRRWEYLHTFLDVDGENITFRVLINGELHEKISKDDEKVIFYDTPFTWEGYCDDEDEWEDDEAERFKGLVFKKTDGEYRLCISEESPRMARLFDGVVLTLPEAPQADDLDAGSAKKLFEDYETAFYLAFAAAERFREFSLEDDGMRYAEMDGFFLKGTFAVPERADVQRTERWADDLAQNLSLEVDDMLFFAGDMEGMMTVDDNSTLEIYVTDEETRVLCNASFDSLRDRGVFDGKGLPEILRFEKRYESLKENMKYYQIIKEAVVDYISMKRGASGKQDDKPDRTSRKAMEELLYPEEKGWEPDENVVSFAAELYNYCQAEAEEARLKPLNVALFGEAGTGKSTLIKKIGKVVLDRENKEGEKVLVLSPSDLRGAYVGQTQPRIAMHLVEAAAAKKAIYIDEAYELMSDQFGREAVAFLLPLMTGDRTYFEVETLQTFTLGLKQDDTGETRNVTFFNRNPKTSAADTMKVDFKTGQVMQNGELVGRIPCGVPPIWIGGYENEIRLLLRENQGLYRRFRKCRLAKPRTEQLYKAFWRSFEKKKGIDPKFQRGKLYRQHF